MRSVAASLLALAALLPVSIAASAFDGRGQLRTLYISGDHEDLGCLTSDGKWTVNEDQCGVFIADRINEAEYYLSSEKAGPCGVQAATFKCAEDVKPGIFGVSFFLFVFVPLNNTPPPPKTLLSPGKRTIEYRRGSNVADCSAPLQTWGTPGPIPGHEVLRYSQYGVFATNAPDSPPALNAEPLAIHFYSGIEKGKWVWLGWESLSKVEAVNRQ